MGIVNRVKSFWKRLISIPSRMGKILFRKEKSPEKIKRSGRMLVILYLLFIVGVIGAYALRGPIGEILIQADPIPFEIENEEGETGEDAMEGKDSPYLDVFAPDGETRDEGEEPVAEDEDEVLDEDVAKEKEEELEAAFSPSSPLIWPLDGRVLVKHGEMFRVDNQLRSHVGIDIESDNGSDVMAVWHGTVKETGKSLLLGSYVLLSHGDEYLTYYANLGETKVREGSSVEAGDVIASTGNSAIVDAGPGEHLHFAIYVVEREGDTRREVPVDPLEFLREEP